MKGFATTGVIVAILAVAVVGLVGMNYGWFEPGSTVGPGTVPPEGCANPDTGRTLNLTFQDEYTPGAQVTSFGDFLYRKSGDLVWSSATGGGTTGLEAGATYEVILGLSGTGVITAHPQPIDKYTDTIQIGCGPSTTKTYQFSDDEAATSLTASALDTSDNDVIDGGHTIDIDNGGAVTIPFKWYAGFEENFGTLACGPMSNVIVVHVNATEYDDVDVTYDGTKLTKTEKPNVLASVSGYDDYAFFAPVIESSKRQADWAYSLELDPDDTINPDGGESNVTIYYYDSFIYVDNDDNKVYCGVEDEDNTEIGATAADSHNIAIEDD